MSKAIIIIALIIEKRSKLRTMTTMMPTAATENRLDQKGSPEQNTTNIQGKTDCPLS